MKQIRIDWVNFAVWGSIGLLCIGGWTGFAWMMGAFG